MITDRDKKLTEHIFEAIEAIERFTRGKTKEEFLDDEMLSSAVIKKFEIIGEACSRLTGEFQADHPNIPWREIIGMRNILIHDYFGTDLEGVWNSVEEDLPKLKERFRTISNRER